MVAFASPGHYFAPRIGRGQKDSRLERGENRVGRESLVEIKCGNGKARGLGEIAFDRISPVRVVSREKEALS